MLLPLHQNVAVPGGHRTYYLKILSSRLLTVRGGGLMGYSNEPGGVFGGSIESGTVVRARGGGFKNE